MLRFYSITGIYVVLVICFFIYTNTSTAIIATVCSTLLYSIFIFWGASNIRSGLFIKTLNSNPNAKKRIAITFDDGPHPKKTTLLLELLKKYNAQASFFMIGKEIEEHSEIVQKVHEAGHFIGNHSYSHSNFFPLFSSKKIIADLTKTQELINNISQEKNKYFRPPFGVTNPLVAKAVSKLNLKTIGWSIRSFDTTSRTTENIIKKVLRKIKDGDIILLHDTTNKTYAVTQAVLEYSKDREWQVVRVDELLKN